MKLLMILNVKRDNENENNFFIFIASYFLLWYNKYV